MVELFKLLGNKRLFVLLVGLVTFIALMGFTLGPRTALSWPEKFLKDSVGFVQYVFYKPASSVAGFFKDLANMRTVYQENEELRIAMGHYTRDRLKYNDMEQVNEQLQKALNFTEEQKNRYNYGSRIAQVISANSDPNSRTINIDIGENAGIKAGMAVTSQEGLVGVVSHVSSYTSTVNLLTSMDANDPTSNAIAATAVGKEKVFGMIESYDPKTGMLKMTKISEDSDIKKDDEIISSGIINNFPKYMRIGKVEKVEVGEYGLTRTAIIKPYASFLDWKELIVIIPPEVKE
ncbi:rod shape-determining protein MreC [Paenibacillus taichungensis]|uniref:rod shape-determining protein MreC n=1 Tax=Paenibacillus TaxID=44249 RepID=UPI0009A69342|nr:MULTISPECIES: rod shape-determining protein MreC [Paenibacillus]MEC0109392.1 rod shape-determining protein MreC [Paenibacillus taichungensis]MEC0196397.1 rod shape-determining protein MreC [Paenibacillus taichungensis]SLK14542.1 rod shape-determining protein MreC [Paenibacillus sp. RU5A]SOC73511.1 rod shape-determining protein MreC [Paenibacillus sp. RU26A]SOC75686.1 rod shape-determining protein MreC [Paenibacillus sp. RU5M]